MNNFMFIPNLNYNDIVFLCAGTEKVVGDSFGPKVATKLKNINEKVFTVSFANVNKCIEKIYEETKTPYIIVIDAALSSSEKIGEIIIEKGETALGSGLNKKGVVIGDVSIKGVVAYNYKETAKNLIALKNVSQSLINNMVDETINKIKEEMYIFHKYGNN